MKIYSNTLSKVFFSFIVRVKSSCQVFPSVITARKLRDTKRLTPITIRFILICCLIINTWNFAWILETFSGGKCGCTFCQVYYSCPRRKPDCKRLKNNPVIFISGQDGKKFLQPLIGGDISLRLSVFASSLSLSKKTTLPDLQSITQIMQKFRCRKPHNGMALYSVNIADIVRWHRFNILCNEWHAFSCHAIVVQFAYFIV